MDANDETTPLSLGHPDDEKQREENALVENNDEVLTLATAQSASPGLAGESVNDTLVEGTHQNTVMDSSGQLGDREQEYQHARQVKEDVFSSNIGAGAIGSSASGSEAENVQAHSSSTVALRLLLSYHDLMQRFETINAQRLQTISRQRDIIAELRDQLRQYNRKAREAQSSSLSQAAKNAEGKEEKSFVAFNFDPPTISTFGNDAVYMTANTLPMVSPPMQMQDVAAAAASTYGVGESVENTVIENDSDNSDQERASAEQGFDDDDDDTDVDVEAISDDSPENEDHTAAP